MTLSVFSSLKKNSSNLEIALERFLTLRRKKRALNFIKGLSDKVELK